MTKQALTYAEIRCQNYDTFKDDNSEYNTETSEQSEIQLEIQSIRQIGTQTENNRFTQWYKNIKAIFHEYGPEITCAVTCIIIIVVFVILSVDTVHT